MDLQDQLELIERLQAALQHWRLVANQKPDEKSSLPGELQAAVTDRYRRLCRSGLSCLFALHELAIGSMERLRDEIVASSPA